MYIPFFDLPYQGSPGSWKAFVCMFTLTISSLPLLRPGGIFAAVERGNALCSPYATLVGVGAVVAVFELDDPPPPHPDNAAQNAGDATRVTNLECCISYSPDVPLERLARRRVIGNADDSNITSFLPACICGSDAYGLLKR